MGVNGATLTLTKSKAVAALPPQKGENFSYMLTQSGQLAKVPGGRICGVGVARYLKENGFAQAHPGDPVASKLADLIDIQEGIALVEAASVQKAAELQRQFAGQVCTFVPFDEERPSEAVTVAVPRSGTVTSWDLTSGFSSGTVETEYRPGSPYGMSLALSSGWLVGPDGDASQMPRNTGYGGLVERAAYIICNTGLAQLVGAKNLMMDETAAENAPYPRGLLELVRPNGDRIQVGIDAGDEVGVAYQRGGALLYSRAGITQPRLGEVIGAIAAVMVRVGEMDAEPVKTPRKKAA
ncbi:hypothetical protein WL29_21595 [Burkholderia ubonensis]|uniref:Uncharacterized protein n=1 Tax=Burkholderia ubonensis TaxID=101571 RepID=A0A106QD89_9BURK|nr:hypothetical protein WL29_21595 [Burkholderia ubonensis]